MPRRVNIGWEARSRSNGMKLSQETERRVKILFASPDRRKAIKLLEEECGNNLPFLENLDEFGLERFRFAALKCSGGSLPALRKAVELAKLDWRDLLVSAGFGDDVNAHLKWVV